MITKAEAIKKVIEQNAAVQDLLNKINAMRQATEAQCNQMNGQANQLVGRNDQLRETFGITEKELQEAIDKKPPAEEPDDAG
jgi:DNA-binding FrmR family transcriptional regulator